MKYYNNEFDRQITTNFKAGEFACKDGAPELYINTIIVNKLQELRDKVKFEKKADIPIIIVSGYRTKKYNEKCGGSPNSKHLTGDAIDFYFNNTEMMSNKNIFLLAIELNFTYKINGIGIYINREKNFIHIDNREEHLIWVNDTKTQSYYKNVYDYLVKEPAINEVQI